MVQYEVAKVPLPALPAALTLAGPLSTVNVDNSNNWYINGTDQCGVQNVPAVGTVAENTGNQAQMDAQATQSMNNFINAIPSQRDHYYTGVDGCSPDVQNVNHLSDQMFNTVDGLQGLVKSVEGAATNTYGTNPSTPDIGCFSCSPQRQRVTVVQGDMSLSSTDGYGILLVTGKLTLSGDFSFHGLVLVIGQGEIDENGGGNGGIVGGMVLAKIGDNSGCGVAGGNCYSTNPTDQNLLQHLGAPVWNYPGGGANGFNYNSCMLQTIVQAADFTVIARREITY